MGPDQSQPTAAEPISIDLDFNKSIQRFDKNITQEIFLTTADKARLCLDGNAAPNGAGEGLARAGRNSRDADYCLSDG